MPETPQPPRRGRDYMEERVHELANKVDLLSYKHGELERDFREYRQQTQDKMKWTTAILLTFIGSVVLPAITIIATLLSKGDPAP